MVINNKIPILGSPELPYGGVEPDSCVLVVEPVAVPAPSPRMGAVRPRVQWHEVSSLVN